MSRRGGGCVGVRGCGFGSEGALSFGASGASSLAVRARGIEFEVLIEVVHFEQRVMLQEMNLGEQKVRLGEMGIVQHCLARALLRFRESNHGIEHPSQTKVAAGVGRIDGEARPNDGFGIGKLLAMRKHQAQAKMRGSVDAGAEFDGLAKSRFGIIPTLQT